jgi:hypothetical protein
MSLFYFDQQCVGPVNPSQPPDHQVNPQAKQAGAHQEHGYQKAQYLVCLVMGGKYDQKADNGQGKGQNRYAGAQGGQAGALLRQDQLGLVDNYGAILRLGTLGFQVLTSPFDWQAAIWP